MARTARTFCEAHPEARVFSIHWEWTAATPLPVYAHVYRACDRGVLWNLGYIWSQTLAGAAVLRD